MALTLVPVSMSQSLEFNGFLEALEIAAPRGNALAQLQESHHTVVEWIHAAVAGQAHLEEDVLSAGTIVAFRALGAAPPPLPSDEPARRRDATAAEAWRSPRRRSERSDDIERALEQTAAELADARAEAEGARAEAAEASARLIELEQADAGLQSGLAEARRALEEMRAQVEGLRDGLSRAARPARAWRARRASGCAARPSRARRSASGCVGSWRRCAPPSTACAATWPARPRPRSACASRSSRRAPRSTPWRQRCRKSAGCPDGSTRSRRAWARSRRRWRRPARTSRSRRRPEPCEPSWPTPRARIERIESERAEERERLERELEAARERLREEFQGTA